MGFIHKTLILSQLKIPFLLTKEDEQKSIVVILFYLIKGPVRKVLECKRTFRRVRNKIRCLQVEKVFYYVTILKTLQEQLKSKTLLKMVYSGSKAINSENSNYYCSVFTDLTRDDSDLTSNSKQHVSRVEHVF